MRTSGCGTRCSSFRSASGSWNESLPTGGSRLPPKLRRCATETKLPRRIEADGRRTDHWNHHRCHCDAGGSLEVDLPGPRHPVIFNDGQAKLENQRLREEVSELKERLKVIERITVEKENSLAKEIESLRDR